MNNSSTTLITQTVFKTELPSFTIRKCHENELAKLLPPFLSAVGCGVIGLAASYGAQCRLTSLAISTATHVLEISLSKKSKNQHPSRTLLQRVLSDETYFKFAFQMDQLAAALFLDHELQICQGKDLLSVSKQGRESLGALMDALGGEITLHKTAVKTLLYDEARASPTKTALEAWAAHRAAVVHDSSGRLEVLPFFNTVELDVQMLVVIAKTIRDANRLLALKPLCVKNDIKSKFVPKGEKLTVESERFKTRLMPTASRQVVKVTTIEADGSSRTVMGGVPKTSGRKAKIELKGNSTIAGNAQIQSVETIGRDDPSSSEVWRSEIMRFALQSTISLSSYPFINLVWLGKKNLVWEANVNNSKLEISFPGERTLNPSQARAVKVILSNKDMDRVALIHGPPGTGKTTVIAASVTSVMSSNDTTKTMWLVAHSNVAVKNMAEKLATVNFWDFKILVSKDFHFDWHEHLYEKIEKNLIRSDDFAKHLVSAERQLLGARVILCTVAMLSNEKLDIYVRLVPLQTVIFDEASQIEVGDYFPMLIRFRTTLRKLVFIGDDKQLAPYGAADVPDLESIFEKGNLRQRAVFLDTQYRMPIPIGAFISQHVYNNKLHSQHGITDRLCCRFVNVSNGVEEPNGHSFQNTCEANVAVKVAAQLEGSGKSFRIITPYDPQRGLLERFLKEAKVSWKDKCFNIDSFQGNEEDYIIISLVRSKKLGFLREKRRVNVMLSRCKKGMIICTSRNFIRDQAGGSLVGKLAKSLGNAAWVEAADVLQNCVRPFL